ncbi:TPA: phage tail tape measure protein [Proteus mirabilis]|uniref:phage tail tape measure protein n=1 Tax=Proteus mirabilis TaxID=584 RepID=UPI0008E384EB|nr:phage tail tape measure protein [Proteus mirabilis]DAL55931.1 MAG TPA_asm: Tail tape measure [Caudoviricetes sp.]ELA7863506.1 phage tail tape measure protein [Proteus mirabilis]MBG2893158.1 phage tail tape measure protein [Proteus mirabilis]MBG2953726.1 phage tail tape measure protein [Proteus mirabilis]MBG2972766.1 phage tail tape measure protein [Proteus mirabilis]
MAGALGTLNIDLTLNTASFTNAINRSQHQTERFNQSVRLSLQSITVQQERMASQTAKSAMSFANFAKVVTGALSINQVINYADSWTDLQNRMKLVTNSTEALNKATNDVYTIAQKTYQSLDATAQVYQRFSDNAERLGINQQKVAELTETVSKAVSLSGTSAAAAATGLTQFGQALAAGQLRGQDLNSVIEQIPGLAQAIAEGMGISMGELKQRAQDGETSIDKIIESLERVKASVDQKFATSVTTVSQSFTNLQSAMTKFVGEANQSTGATQLLNTGLSVLSNNFSEVMKVVEALAVTAIVIKITKWTQATYAQTTATKLKVQQDLIAAKATQAKMTAELELARVEMRSLQAQLQLAQTEAQRSSIRMRMKAQSSIIVSATNAETLATQRLNAAQRASSTLGRGFGGALAFLGGPLGIATGLLTAGAMAYYEWQQQAEQSRQKALEYAESLDVATESLNKLSDAERQASIGKLFDSFDAQIEKIEELKKKQEELKRLSDFGGANKGISFYYTGDYEAFSAEVVKARKDEIQVTADLEEKNRELEAIRKKMALLLDAEVQKNGMVSNAYALYAGRIYDASVKSDELIGKLHLQGSAFDNLAQSIRSAAQEQQQFSANSLIIVSADAQKSIDASLRAIEKAKATGEALAKLNAEDVLASRKVTPDMQGYDKALQAEIDAQLALQSKKIKPPKTPKSSIDYAKQYTKILSDLQEKQASLIADGQSIQLYGTTSSFNEYNSALADIKKNKEKFDAILKIDPKAIETIKEKAKAIDDMARANSVAQFAYDRGKEVEQMQFETSLIGKSRAEQERLNALRQVDLLYQQAKVDLGDKELANLQNNVELTKQKIEAELQKRELMKLDPVEGLNQGLSDFGDSATNVMENVKNVTANALNNMSDSLADFVLTGKGSFKDFANAVISDITRMVMKMLVFKAIEAGTSFFMGGASGGSDAGGGPGGLFAYGGYTGHGGKFEPKGIVHGGEFVFTKEATAKLGIGNLYRLMNSTQGYASGGFVGSLAGKMPSSPVTTSSSSGVNITVVNQITVTGNGDSVLVQAMKEAAQQGTDAGAQKARAMILQDFQSNGTARRTLGV